MSSICLCEGSLWFTKPFITFLVEQPKRTEVGGECLIYIYTYALTFPGTPPYKCLCVGNTALVARFRV